MWNVEKEQMPPIIGQSQAVFTCPVHKVGTILS